MQDSFPLPSCFSSGEKYADVDPASAPAGTKSGQSAVMSVYRTKIGGRCRLITVTWCRDLLIHGLSISIEGSDHDGSDSITQYSCKVELRPWYFWRKHGSKRFDVEGRPVGVLWDLRNANFSGDTEPRSGYYVALIADEEVVLLLGDQKKDAFRRSGCRPSMITADVTLVARKEHVFGKKRFLTRTKFDEKGVHHEISIECACSGSSIGGDMDPEMVIMIDGRVAVHVKRLQWKFRGNETISVCKSKVEVYWDVHDWLFSPGMRRALFIFKPSSPPTSSSSSSTLSSLFSSTTDRNSSSSGFCLFLYAWKLE